MSLKLLEQRTQWADLAEKYISILKAAVIKDLQELNCPLVLWCYCIEYRTRVHNVKARDSLHLDGKNPYLVTTGDTADISNLCLFKFYNWAYYMDWGESILGNELQQG